MIFDLEDEPFVSLWIYWTNVCGERLLPDSQDIDLTKLASIFPNVSVLDVISPDEIRYHIVGSDIVAGYGDELTGLNLLDLFSEESRQHLSQSLIEVVTRPCAGFCQTAIAYQSGRKNQAQILSTPLKTGSESLGRALMVQKIDQPRTQRGSDNVTLLGAGALSTQYIDIGNGIGEDISVTF